MADDAGDRSTAAGGDTDESASRDVSDDDSEPTAEAVDSKETGPTDADGRRQVVVPQELFRVVVVFSTVLSIVSVLLGFALLDAATRVVDNPTGSLVVGVVSAVSGSPVAALEPHLGTIALVVGLAGIGSIGLGVWIYAIGTRFRAEMGKPKERADEDSGNG